MATCRLLIIALGALISSSLYAQDAARSDEQRAYEAELRKLKEADSAKYAQTRRAFTLFAEILLGRMGYGVGPFDGVLSESDQQKLRAYEEKRGLPVTGDPLSFRTMEQVSKDLNALDYSPVSLPNLFVYLSDWDEGYVSANGTWALVNETQAIPEQAVTLECFRESRVCAEATALIMRTLDTPGVSVDIDWYDIERWDDKEIVTKPKEFGCTRYIRRINRIQKSVTGVRSTISTEGSCKGMEAKDLFMTLADGVKVYSQLLEKQRKNSQKLLLITPEAAKALEEQ